MTTVQMPGTNQPIDYDFINQLVTQVNYHDGFISQTSTNGTSSILKQSVISNKLKTHAEEISIPATSAEVSTTVAVPSPTFSGFSNTPIVIVTAKAKNTTSAAGCTILVSNVTATTCDINVRWLEKKASGVEMSINLLAIGPTA
jgi:hypothetical protein